MKLTTLYLSALIVALTLCPHNLCADEQADVIYHGGVILTIDDKNPTSEAIALKAMTLWPAYQHFEEKTNGSLEVGKLADLVILDTNPLTIDPKTINQIKIVETIKEGVTVFPRVASAEKPLTESQRQAMTWHFEGPCDLAHLNEIAGKESTLAALNGKEIAADKPPTIKFEDGRVSAFGGVKRLSGTNVLNDHNVTFGAMVSTRMAGAPS